MSQTQPPSLGFYNDARTLLISPLTPLHAGAGSTPSAVDLPVQRDPLGYPVVYASTIKGALKTLLWHRDRNLAKALLGPEPDEEKYTSPLAIVDANLLLIPARSPEGILMATSPHLLARALDTLELLAAATHNAEIAELKDILERLQGLQLGTGQAHLYDRNHGDILVAGLKLQLTPLGDEEKNALSRLAEKIRDALPNAYKGLLPRSITVVSDTAIHRVIERSLIRQTRVQIDRTTKTVGEKRGLWTEEHLPPGTLLLGGTLLSKLLLKNSIKRLYKDQEKTASEIIREFQKMMHEIGYLVLGGKESTGRGIAKITLLPTPG